MAKSTFNQALADEICQVISTSPKMLEELCAERPHWPCYQTVYEWRIKYSSFGDAYARAKHTQIDALVNHIFVLLRDKSQDYYINDEGKTRINHAYINKLKIEVDAIKWLASKLMPKLYGDRNPKTDDNTDDAISKVRID